jgi:surfactin synthase thioesterase subunit
VGLGGIPAEMLDNPAFLSMFLPKLHADFRHNDSLPYCRSPAFDFPLTIVNGRDHPLVAQEKLEEWGDDTRSAFTPFQVGGGHFFIHSHFRAFIDIVAGQLAGLPDG